MKRPKRISDAIVADEIGIEYGRYGDFTLKSAYQKIFRREDGLLRPFAVEGLVMPFFDGEAVEPETLFEATPAEDKVFVESMCRTLHLRNYDNIGEPGLVLFFNFDPRINSDFAVTVKELEFIAGRYGEIQLESRLLVCEIIETQEQDIDTLLRITAEMRRHGIRLAIDDFGVGHSNLERVKLIRPNIIKIDGGWFRQIAAVPAAAALFKSFVSGLHDLGAQVLVEGIETPEQLSCAVEAGAEYLQGFLLSRPRLAGTIFDPSPLRIDVLLQPGANVVPLFK
ncbi:MAG: EAL domain-containing protein [Rhizobiaceae bacterium]|jgi:EAL domain-containing protein (putative c-di-GMP-specific phosphodiesterase class I)